MRRLIDPRVNPIFGVGTRARPSRWEHRISLAGCRKACARTKGNRRAESPRVLPRDYKLKFALARRGRREFNDRNIKRDLRVENTGARLSVLGDRRTIGTMDEGYGNRLFDRFKL